MNYLTRPVFEFQVNWASDFSRSFTFDLREVSLGFGAEVFTSRQQNVVNGWSVRIDLPTETDIDAFDDFTTALGGRLYGFWLPVPLEGCRITAGVDSTHFDITDQRLRDSWQDSPDKHLYFIGNGLAARAAKITMVADNGNGTERVTVDQALVPAPSAQDSVFRLHYVRLADDAERATFPRENHQHRMVSMIELPTEYADVEIGEDPSTSQPVFLYHFWMAAPIDYHWYYTSFAANVISGSNTHVAATITHGNLKRGMKFEAETVDIRAAYVADHPLSLFLPIPAPRPMNIVISQAPFSDPDTVTTLFTGRVRRVSDNGQFLTAQCDSFLSVLRQRIPPMLIKKTCDYQVFETRTCKAVQAEFQTSGHITAIDNTVQPPTVTMTLRFPTGPKITLDYFAQGWMETGQGLNFEVRTIFNSTWSVGPATMTLKINGPLLNAVVGQEVQLIPGCDGLNTTCLNKFNNFEHFPGFVAVPRQNPSLIAIENKTSAGDKK